MSRIQTTFEQLQQQQRRALIPFLTAGDPAPELTVPLMHRLVASGADVIELGVPFSDPMADGPTIQRASERALKHKVGLHHVLDMVAEFRKTDNKTPMVLMGYGNPVEAMGWQKFADRCVEVGVDGVLTVDFPPEEGSAEFNLLIERGIDPIFLLAPTSSEARIEKVAKIAKGYVYYVSLKGVTGAGHLDLAAVEAKIPQLRKHIKVPIGVGFGIRDAETAQAIGRLCDGVVVGSRIVQEIEKSTPDNVLDNVGTLVQGLRTALDQI